MSYKILFLLPLLASFSNIDATDSESLSSKSLRNKRSSSVHSMPEMSREDPETLRRENAKLQKEIIKFSQSIGGNGQEFLNKELKKILENLKKKDLKPESNEQEKEDLGQKPIIRRSPSKKSDSHSEPASDSNPKKDGLKQKEEQAPDSYWERRERDDAFMRGGYGRRDSSDSYRSYDTPWSNG